MQSVKVRNLVIGEGVPKICVPVVARDENDAVIQVEKIIAMKPDIVEFRADHYEKWEDSEALTAVLCDIRKLIGDISLLFTFRTKGEGGNACIDVDDYVKLCTLVCESRLVDLIDIEAFFQDELLRQMVRIAHDNNVFVVASNHDFNGTPDVQVLVDRLTNMDKNDADILKLAVMPESDEDVIKLMSALLQYRSNADVKPVIGMSMGGCGVVSRLTGEFFGSAVTFASACVASAPGQIPVNEVRTVLEIIHRYQ